MIKHKKTSNIETIEHESDILEKNTDTVENVIEETTDKSPSKTSNISTWARKFLGRSALITWLILWFLSMVISTGLADFLLFGGVFLFIFGVTNLTVTKKRSELSNFQKNIKRFAGVLLAAIAVSALIIYLVSL